MNTQKSGKVFKLNKVHQTLEKIVWINEKQGKTEEILKIKL